MGRILVPIFPWFVKSLTILRFVFLLFFFAIDLELDFHFLSPILYGFLLLFFLLTTSFFSPRWLLIYLLTPFVLGTMRRFQIVPRHCVLMILLFDPSLFFSFPFSFFLLDFSFVFSSLILSNSIRSWFSFFLFSSFVLSFPSNILQQTRTTILRQRSASTMLLLRIRSGVVS